MSRSRTGGSPLHPRPPSPPCPAAAARALALALGSVALASACGPASPAVAPVARTAAVAPAAAGPGPAAPWVHARWRVHPWPPTALHWLGLWVQLLGTNGAPLTTRGLQVGGRLQMAAMPLMPVPPLTLRAAGSPATYTGRLLFVMGGAWTVVLAVRAGARVAQLRLQVEVRQ
jgi:hypothetical protein